MNKFNKSHITFLDNCKRFWLWFQKYASEFHAVVHNHNNIEENFFDFLVPELARVREDIQFLTGMYDEKTAELIFTTDGNIRNFVFIEDLVNQAPVICGWKFTALKPPMAGGNIGIEMEGYHFNPENMFFYSNDHEDYPDNIDISVIHSDLDKTNIQEINSGVFVFLDNYLGELNFAENIDNLTIISPKEAVKELIPISKLNDFLLWRQKEFTEKYEDVNYDTSNDKHTLFDAETETGSKLLAIINSKLLAWDNKVSHPWMAVITIQYDGSHSNGLPSEKDYDRLDKIEESIGSQLIDSEGYLYIGRQIGDNAHEMYYACKEFRKPSRVLSEIQEEFSNEFNINFDIYKDKYWKTFQHLKGI